MLSSRKKLLILQTIVFAVFAMVIGIFATVEAPKLEGGISIGYDANAYEARVTTDSGNTYKYYTTLDGAISGVPVGTHNSVITVLKNATQAQNHTISNKTIQILADKAITITRNSSVGFSISENGKLTFGGGNGLLTYNANTSVTGTVFNNSGELNIRSNTKFINARGNDSFIVNVINKDAKIDIDGTNIEFFNNIAGNGGVIKNEPGGTLTISGSAKFNNNKANAYGGVIYNFANVEINGSVEFGNNEAGNGGGVIFNDYNSNLTISGNLVFDNNKNGSGTSAQDEDIYTMSAIEISNTFSPKNSTGVNRAVKLYMDSPSNEKIIATATTAVWLDETSKFETLNSGYGIYKDGNNLKLGKISTVTFNGDGHTSGSTAAQSFTYGIAKALNANGFKKTGYEFAGWAEISDGAVKYADKANYSIGTSNTTLYAKWTPNTYTISYAANKPSTATENLTGSTANSTHTYDTAKNLTTNGYSLTGWRFNGWNTMANGSGTGYADKAPVTNLATSGTVTLHAQWLQNTYKVKFNANSGSGTMSDQSFNYEESKALTANSFTRTGYTFTGWNTAANGSGTAYADKVSVSKLTATHDTTVNLYAQWGINSYEFRVYHTDLQATNTTNIKVTATNATVTNGTAVAKGSYATIEAEYGANVIVTIARTGSNTYYMATGSTPTTSSSTNSITTPSITIGTTNDNINVYVYQQYVVSYSKGTGTGTAPSSQNKIHGTAITLSTSSITKTGYTLYGWNNGAETTNGTRDYTLTGSYTDNVTRTLNPAWTVNSYEFKVYHYEQGLTTTTNIKVTATNATVTNGTAVAKGSYATIEAEYGANVIVTIARTGSNTYYMATGSKPTTSSSTNSITTPSITIGTTNDNINVYVYQQYVVSYSKGTGTGTAPSSQYKIHGTAITLSTSSITKTGYTFDGWNKNAETTDGTRDYAVTGSYADNVTRTLYPAWYAKTYTLILDANGGIMENYGGWTYIGEYLTMAVAHNVAIGTIPIASQMTRTGYNFSSWNTKADGTGATITSSTPYTLASVGETIYAKWTPITYTLTFNPGPNGSVSPTSKSVTFDAQIGSLPTPTKLGATFDEWQIDAGTISSGTIWEYAENKTASAIWKPNFYTLYFDANGGTVSPTKFEGLTYGQETATLPTPTRQGFTFDEWQIDYDTIGGVGNMSGFIWNYTDDKTAKALWNPIYYTLTFNADGGTVNPTSLVNLIYDQPTGTLPTPIKPGYSFVSWIINSTVIGTAGHLSGFTWNYTQNQTATATWMPTPYTITINKDGGTGGSNNSSYTISTSQQTQTLVNPTKSGYGFIGWTVSTLPTSGTPTVENGGMGPTLTIPANTYGNFTLKANWGTANFKIGSISYTELQHAIDAVPAGTGSATTIVILKNYTITSTVTIPSNKYIKLLKPKENVTDFSIERNSTFTNGPMIINDGKFIVEGRVVFNGKSYGSVAIRNNNDLYISGGTPSDLDSNGLNVSRVIFKNNMGGGISGGGIVNYGNLTLHNAVEFSNNGYETPPAPPLIHSLTYLADIYIELESNISVTGAVYSSPIVLTLTTLIPDKTIIATTNISSSLNHFTLEEGRQYKRKLVIENYLTLKYREANKITFNGNGSGSSVPTNSRDAYAYDGEAMPTSNSDGNSLQPPTRSGYTFMGYYDATSGGTQYYTASMTSARTWNKTSDTTLYARWEADRILTVTYHTRQATNSVNLKITSSKGTVSSNGSSLALAASATVTMPYSNTSATITIARATTSYSYFIRVGAAPTSDYDTTTYSYTPTSNATINIYVYQRYSITYNLNSGSGTTPGTQYKIHGTAITLASKGNISRTNYAFEGWNTNSSGTGSNYGAGTSYTGNAGLTLHAKWVLANFKMASNYYVELQDAIDAVPTGTSTATDIEVLRNNTMSSTATIPSNKYIRLLKPKVSNTTFFTISRASSFNIGPFITNNGKLDITGRLSFDGVNNQEIAISNKATGTLRILGESVFDGYGQNYTYVKFINNGRAIDNEGSLTMTKEIDFTENYLTMGGGTIRTYADIKKVTKASTIYESDVLTGGRGAIMIEIGSYGVSNNDVIISNSSNSYLFELVDRPNDKLSSSGSNLVYKKGYKITFNGNNGTVPTNSNTAYAFNGEQMPTSNSNGSLQPPTRAGHVFKGYFDTSASSGGTQYYTASMTSSRTWNKTADTTLYARWESDPLRWQHQTITSSADSTFINTVMGGSGNITISHTMGGTLTPTFTPSSSGNIQVSFKLARFVIPGSYNITVTRGGEEAVFILIV